ncbi:hypothetical protein [Thalassospira lucentensis]|uniref:hypothetical protein n=1 Tax=Thalassospira lucentensis TaxID=168935 RepID=UPI00142D77C1|nr:hypothetical protein [Thalassospira lucentensis]NIZ00149.1 hypothetical protein [Thalassospira lucentensis]
MALENTSDNLDDVLFVVVTCTRDSSREKALNKLVSSINKENRKGLFGRNVLFFDNASTSISPLKSLETDSVFALSSNNIGYWSALHWATQNASDIFHNDFKYIHPIESDLVLYNIERLTEAKSFLDQNDAYSTVRTQEFSVRQKQRFLKNSGTLFPVRRSRVAPFHGVTGKDISIDKTDCENKPNIYTSEWHAKVPALHRMDVFKDVLEILASNGNITELMFMERMYEKSKRVGLLDKGIYYCNLGTRFWPWEKKWLTGSWSDAQTLKKHGYLSSRHSKMIGSFPDIEIVDTLT